MASLNSFGSILTHAIELETQVRDYYQRVGNEQRAADADRRRQTMERVRREHVTEIKLEPIQGLDADNYPLNLNDISAQGQQAVEQTAARFYQDVAPTINVREAQRALERAGRQHAESAGS
jgi:hypothetical protein